MKGRSVDHSPTAEIFFSTYDLEEPVFCALHYSAKMYSSGDHTEDFVVHAFTKCNQGKNAENYSHTCEPAEP